MYGEFSRITPRLKENDDYSIDEKVKAVTLTEEGIEKVGTEPLRERHVPVVPELGQIGFEIGAVEVLG